MIDHDQQILESVSVRRHRLLKALLYGQERTRRKYDDGVKLLLIGAVVATLICAGCVGYSFIVNLFAQQEARMGAFSILGVPLP
ncbi:hypothetical protein [Nesterenkonia jeotgali]|uniref:Uncharacterized protein n=1 Tax=Nesterenkonia jeotgali TaxID=317018 RepID=A0A0W8IHU8_9MICC|nr:hypothetical protein [Nesterenkonia jeotgali]KUG59598.1 hypothetical protein AVL63_10720 [Nesterenkonia jeotgali]MBA8922178.1 hypothetical protein [Nesterenkonia jeotgali]